MLLPGSRPVADLHNENGAMLLGNGILSLLRCLVRVHILQFLRGDEENFVRNLRLNVSVVSEWLCKAACPSRQYAPARQNPPDSLGASLPQAVPPCRPAGCGYIQISPFFSPTFPKHSFYFIVDFPLFQGKESARCSSKKSSNSVQFSVLFCPSPEKNGILHRHLSFIKEKLMKKRDSFTNRLGSFYPVACVGFSSVAHGQFSGCSRTRVSPYGGGFDNMYLSAI